MNVSGDDLVLAVASVDDAAVMVDVIHAAFGARPALDPPSTALGETPESVRAVLARGGGILASVAGRAAGVVLIDPVRHGLATFQRVSVHPDFQGHGVASAMVAAAQDHAAGLGFRRVELFARAEFEQLVSFWLHRGFTVDRAAPHGVMLAKDLPLLVDVPTSEDMQELGERLAGVLVAGDLVILSGELGAGKTTLTQGIGRGLGSADRIISPTFVLSRVHHSAEGRPDLVHVDAYRLPTAADLDDLDLDATLGSAVTVVEWGAGVAERLSVSRLEIDISVRSDSSGQLSATSPDSSRWVLIRRVGARWQGVDLSVLSACGARR